MTSPSPAHRAEGSSQPVLARRSVLVGALGLTGTAVVGVPLAQAAPAVGSHVAAAYTAAGGAAVLGRAVHAEVRRRIAHHSTYGQRFEHGTAWEGAGVGLVDRPGLRVRLPVAPNFRPVTGVRDLWRTGDLDGCSPLEERVVIDLGIETMIAMNTGGDPAIPGVARHRYPVSNAGTHLEFYRGYVTRHASRTAFGRVARTVARSDAAVLVHCQAGKDRTGWICDVLQAVAGVDRTVRDLDYLATHSYSGADVELAWLDAARSALTSRYGSVTAYLVDGCGVSQSDLRRLRARLA